MRPKALSAVRTAGMKRPRDDVSSRGGRQEVQAWGKYY